MLVLKGAQRAMLVEELPDVANLALGGLVLGQFLSENVFSTELAIVGFVIWALLMVFAAILAGGLEP